MFVYYEYAHNTHLPQILLNVVQHDFVNIGDVHNKMHDVIVFADRTAKDPVIVDPEGKPYIAVPENPLNT